MYSTEGYRNSTTDERWVVEGGFDSRDLTYKPQRSMFVQKTPQLSSQITIMRLGYRTLGTGMTRSYDNRIGM